MKRWLLTFMLFAGLLAVPEKSAQAQIGGSCPQWCDDCCCWTKQYWNKSNGNAIHSAQGCGYGDCAGDLCSQTFDANAAATVVKAARASGDLRQLVALLVNQPGRVRLSAARSAIQLYNCTQDRVIANYIFSSALLGRTADDFERELAASDAKASSGGRQQ